MTSPQLLILGQSTIDHVVPARPGPWIEQPGGNALYAAAGARLWLLPKAVAVVTRTAADYPFDVAGMLAGAGVAHHIAKAPGEHLIEWLIYESDGSRRALPRNLALLGAASDNPGYLDYLLAISPSEADVPQGWRWPPVIYAAPQLVERHDALQTALPDGPLLVVDPSPRYSTSASAEQLRALLPRVDALLLSEQDATRILSEAGNDPVRAVKTLRAAGFPEVVLKLGAAGAVVAASETVHPVSLPPPQTIARDPTGAGDAFGGAYAAARARGYASVEAAQRGTAAAGVILTCEGACAALDAGIAIDSGLT